MTDENKEDFPMPTSKDEAIQYGKPAVGILGTVASIATGIPALSILGTELYSKVLSPTLEKRRANWLNALSDKVHNLSSIYESLKIENLANNELFTTLVLQTTQIALRNHHKEKLESLQNCVLNSAVETNPDEDEILMFVNYVDSLTRWHLKLLKFLEEKSNHERIEPVTSWGMPTYTNAWVGGMLKKQFPELSDRQDFLKQMVNDLIDKGLVVEDTKNTILSSEKDLGSMVTTFVTDHGRRFLKYISPLHT